MRKIFTILLSIIVFCCTMVCLAQPAYTNLDEPTIMTGKTPLEIIQDETNTAFAPTAVIPHEHDFAKFTTQPTCTENGYDKYVCTCGEFYEEEIPSVGHQFDTSVTKPTCTTDGYTTYTCNVCAYTYQDNVIPATGHQYSDWKTTKKATPDVTGTKTRKCNVCDYAQTQTVVFEFKGTNAVYIPSANIHAKFAMASFTQTAVDEYDVVYSWVEYINDPFILGHNNGSMKKLYNTQIGDIIYVNLNGELIRYKVIVSEYGIQNANKNNIIGQSTGATIWDEYDVETLRMYTCYGSVENDRWMVLATRIS